MQPTTSWTLEFQKAFKNLKELYRFLDWKLEPALEAVAEKYPLFIPSSLAQKIKEQGPSGVLAREFLPHENEMKQTGLEDPIGDKTYHKAPQLIHRYASRVLFTPTTVCPVHCRYCFRKNELNQKDELFDADFELTLEYLRSHPEISEIIFTGGDPLTLSNQKIEKYLFAFSEIKSIRDIRFHSRYPVILPQRLDEGFSDLIHKFEKKFRTISLAIHANHVDEFDAHAMERILKLSKTPIQLLSQTVLLKDVNTDPNDLLALFNLFLELNVRPYYLHHPDQVKGGMHFYLSLEEGRRIYSSLRSNLPGWALPQYVIDIPGGHGKVNAFNPETYEYSGSLISQVGTLVATPEPQVFH